MPAHPIGSVTRTGPAFVLLGAVQILLICGITVISVALPAVQYELGLDRGELALVSSAYGLSFSGLLLLGGRLADLYGRRRLFLLGLGLFGCASAAALLAPGFGPLVLARFAQGIGAALAAPAAMALLPALFPGPSRRARALAAWGGLSGVGAVLGMFLSGVIAQWASWRWAFAVLVAASLLALAAALRLLPSDGPVRRGLLDVLGALLAAGGLSMLSYGLLGGSVARIALGALLLIVFALVESRAAAPLVPLSFFASRPRAVALAAIVLASAGMAGSMFFLSLHLQQDRGLSPLRTLAILLPYGLVLIATGAVAGRLSARYGPRVLLVVGLFVATVGLALVSALDGGLLAAGLLVLPLGVGLTFAGATVTVVDDVPERQAGLAGGVVNTAMEVGPTTGLAALVVVASGHAGGYGFALGAAACTFALAALLAAALLRPHIRR
ncbi:MFS transporter [Streptosporangium sp. CA-115845]|uniref:MFS transporter n=1 Tax=Streptosporangium sp. CA-115845 TaxID=3240071 RepID=UPI003D9344B5